MRERAAAQTNTKKTDALGTQCVYSRWRCCQRASSSSSSWFILIESPSAFSLLFGVGGGRSAADVATRSEIDELVHHQRIYNEVDRGKYPEVKMGSKDLELAGWSEKKEMLIFSSFPASIYTSKQLYDIFCLC